MLSKPGSKGQTRANLLRRGYQAPQTTETKSSQRLGSCSVGLGFQFRKMKNSKRWTVMMAAQQCEQTSCHRTVHWKMVQMVDFKTMGLADSLIISHNPKLGFQITKCSANRPRSSCWCEKSVSNSGKRIDKSPLLFPADQREWVKTQSASQKISVRGRKIRWDEMIDSYLWNCCLLLSDSALEISPECYTRGSIHAPFQSMLHK